MTQRILHVVSAMNRGGAETLLMNVYRNIDRDKLQFDFVSHRLEICDYDEEILSLGGRIFRIQSLGQQGPFRYMNELKKIMSQTNYIAVHSHTDYQSGFAVLSAKRAGIGKRICHSHSNNWGRGDGLRARFILNAMRMVIRYAATNYCACSLEAAEFLFGPSQANSRKMHLMKNGIEIKSFINIDPDARVSVRRELNIPLDSSIIGHIGTFSPSKNHRFLLELLERMTEEGKDVTLILAGDGPLRSEIEAEAMRRDLFHRIRFLGVRRDVARLMKAFDVFVFPSLFEGFGIVVLEAQCAGTPCVIADTVPKLTDMGVHLVSYISLEESMEIWSHQICKVLEAEKPDQQTILDTVANRGFDIKDNIHDWLQMYGVS